MSSYLNKANVFLFVLTLLCSCRSFQSQKSFTIKDEKKSKEIHDVTLSYETPKSLEKNIKESGKYEEAHRNPKLLDDYQENSKKDLDKTLSEKVLNSFSKSQKLKYAKKHFANKDYKLAINFLKFFIEELSEEG